jgi:N-omega-hydroxy-L-arginine synthase
MKMALIEQSSLNELYSENYWEYTVYLNVEKRLTHPTEFPCVFSQNAFRRQLIQFSFVDNFDEYGANKLKLDLEQYISESKSWDGKVNTARPLIVAFGHKAAKFDTLEEYHDFGWKVLQYLHNNDSHSWPEDVATDANSPYWSMCFNGVQIFVNMSCPKHMIRKSRNFGDYLVFIINPRERFDIVAGDTDSGRKTRQTIRKRIEAYDSCPHSPQLGSYQAGEVEWWQYGIIEENKKRTDKCPFYVNSNKKAEVTEG